MENQLRLDIDPPDELRAVWQKTLERAEPRLGREALEGWLGDAVLLKAADGLAVLGVPSATARAWVEKRYAAVLVEALSEIRGAETRLQVVVRKAGARSGKAARPEAEAVRPPARPAPSPLFPPFPLNEKYRFANFVVGQSNRFAHAAAMAVAERPGREYNPLFVYGGVGLGKTHLLQAIGHSLLEKNPRARVAYVSGETFTSHFITSLREHREEEFRRAYRGIDIWLVDDIQFIADKTSTKEEFFHTFNELYLTNRQIVLAADRPPRELRLMEDRLRSRLESGLMVEIGPPDLETRMAILQQRAAAEGLEVPPEVLFQVARAVTSNIRLLEAAVIRMVALASMDRCSITAELAAAVVGALVQEGRLAGITAAGIVKAVCDHFRISEAELTGPRRDRDICQARQVAMYLMRELSRKSLSEIGQVFGGKTHSTVLYACSRLEQEIQKDPSLEGSVRVLRSTLTGSGNGG